MPCSHARAARLAAEARAEQFSHRPRCATAGQQELPKRNGDDAGCVLQATSPQATSTASVSSAANGQTPQAQALRARCRGFRTLEQYAALRWHQAATHAWRQTLPLIQCSRLGATLALSCGPAPAMAVMGMAAAPSQGWQLLRAARGAPPPGHDSGRCASRRAPRCSTAATSAPVRRRRARARDLRRAALRSQAHAQPAPQRRRPPAASTGALTKSRRSSASPGAASRRAAPCA